MSSRERQWVGGMMLRERSTRVLLSSVALEAEHMSADTTGSCPALLGLLAAMSFLGCLGSDTILCSSGILCPPGTICTPRGDGCAEPALIRACEGIEDGEPCQTSYQADGICLDGVCLPGTPFCGDGVVNTDLGEACDDAADNSDQTPDACRTSCQLPRCGDSVKDTGEACDDGNNVSGDLCSADCLSLETCGNGILDVAAGEQCDDGNLEPGDGCGATCQLDGCGNGLLEGLEECDDGNHIDGDGCQASCRWPRCGDGILDPGEACDDGNNLSGDGCQEGCLLPRCGDGVQDPGEACDDGNNLSGDGCSSSCLSDEACGNSILDMAAGEECDLGSLNSDSPNARCRSNCKFSRCGDRVIDDQFGEECDGQALGSATCEQSGFYGGMVTCDLLCRHDYSTCEGRCGDGVMDAGEACDGSDFGGQSCAIAGFDFGDLFCLPSCQLSLAGCYGRCGDGIKDPGELCDGNDFGGESCVTRGYVMGSLGCSSGCDVIDESGCVICNDGVRHGDEECDSSDLGGETCLSLDIGYGDLSCASDCQFDTSGCVAAGCTLTEGFEFAVMPPLYWELIPGVPTATWKLSANPHSGTKSALVEYDSSLQPQDEVLISHPIRCSNMSISFWHAGSKMWCCDTYHNYDVALWVVVGEWDGDTPNDDHLITSTLLADGFDAGCPSNPSNPFQYCERAYAIPAQFDGQNIRVAWQYIGTDGASYYLDDVLLQ